MPSPGWMLVYFIIGALPLIAGPWCAERIKDWLKSKGWTNSEGEK